MGGCQENVFTKSGDRLSLEEPATPVLSQGSPQHTNAAQMPKLSAPRDSQETRPHNTEQRTGQGPTERCHLARLSLAVRAGLVESSLVLFPGTIVCPLIVTFWPPA